MGWLRPTVVGLIGAAAVILVMKVSWGGTPLLSTPEVSLVEENIIDWKSWVLMAAAFAASYWGKLNPIFVIRAGGVLGFLLY